MKGANISIIAVVLYVFICCIPASGKGQKVAAAKNIAAASPNNDEQAFRKLFKTLNGHLKTKNINALAPLINFPFYTSRSNLNNNIGAANDPINKAEFEAYKALIFNADVLRLLPKCKEDNLSEIAEKTSEIYYKSLKKLTDPGSKMYEAYIQYPETNTQAESFFGFIFGRVNGTFKTLATYAKWPVK